MDKKIFALNIIIAIVDTIIAALSIVAFFLMSYSMQKWWIMLFALIPLMLFNRHSILILTGDRKEDEDDARRGTP